MFCSLGYLTITGSVPTVHGTAASQRIAAELSHGGNSGGSEKLYNANYSGSKGPAREVCILRWARRAAGRWHGHKCVRLLLPY